MGYKAVYPEEAIQAHLAFLARRRSLRPSEEYRTPTEEEWQEFLGHFERRKVSVGTCARAFGTPCIHEHACVRCSMLWPDPAQRDRLVEIRDNLVARIEEAERERLARRGRGPAGEPRRRRGQARPDRPTDGVAIDRAQTKARDSAPKGRTSLIHPASPADHERPEVNPLPPGSRSSENT